MKEIKVLGYIPLFYGAEYLEACIKSMHNYVEKIVIVYTPRGSQGHLTKEVCPETEDQLKTIAFGASSKVEWHSTNGFPTEGAHRDYILAFSKGYDLVFTLDADEIVDQDDIGPALQKAVDLPSRHIALKGFINFWRSFDWVCLDGFLPYRIVNLKNSGGHDHVDCKVYHFSTAQKVETIRFKWNVSGHKNELKPRWIDNVYLRWTPENQFGDLHPVSIGLWNAVPFDKTKLPEMLRNHPNYNKHII